MELRKLLTPQNTKSCNDKLEKKLMKYSPSVQDRACFLKVRSSVSSLLGGNPLFIWRQSSLLQLLNCSTMLKFLPMLRQFRKNFLIACHPLWCVDGVFLNGFIVQLIILGLQEGNLSSTWIMLAWRTSQG